MEEQSVYFRRTHGLNDRRISGNTGKYGNQVKSGRENVELVSSRHRGSRFRNDITHRLVVALIICSSARLKLRVRSSLISQCHQPRDYIDRLHSKCRYVFATTQKTQACPTACSRSLRNFLPARRVSRNLSMNRVSQLIESSSLEKKRR